MAFDEEVEKRFSHYGKMFSPITIAYKWIFDTLKNLFAVVALGVIAKKGQSGDLIILYRIVSVTFTLYISATIYRLILSIVPQSSNMIVRTFVALLILGPSFAIISPGLSYIEERILVEIISIQTR